MSDRLLRKSSCTIKPGLSLVERELNPLYLMTTSIIRVAFDAIRVHACGIFESKPFTLGGLDNHTVQVLLVADCAGMSEHGLSKRAILLGHEAREYSVIPDVIVRSVFLVRSP